MKVLSLIGVGSQCVITHLGIDGIVIGFMLKNVDLSYVQYQVTWTDGMVRHCEWLEECEIRPKTAGDTQKIGFIVKE